MHYSNEIQMEDKNYFKKLLSGDNDHQQNR